MKKKQKRSRPLWKIWLGGIVVLVVIAVLIGLMLGSGVEVEESETINATPAEIHASLNSFKPWRDKLTETLKQQDSTVEVTLSGPDNGPGASLEWTGEKLGKGRVTITRAEPDAGVWFEGAIRSDDVNARGSVTYAPGDDGTKVTAKLDGDLPPVIGGYVSGLLEEQIHEAMKQALKDLKRDLE